MSNIVVCSCGKSLRAHEGMTEIHCPVCGQVTYFAGLQESHGSSGDSEVVVFGFDPPVLAVPKVQLKYQVVEISSETTPVRRRESTADDDDDRPYPLENESEKTGWKSREELWGPSLDLSSPYPTRRRKRRPRRPGEWTLEKSWYECLAYPVRAWPLLAALGFALTFATFGLLEVLRDDGPFGWVFYLVGAVALTYACGFLSCVLNAGASGDVLEVRWPGANLKILFESLLGALMSFLAGPIIPAAVGVYFWVNAGDITWVDRLILFQLLVVTVGYWLLVFFSVALSDDWSSLLPVAVLQRARQLGIGRTCLALGFVLGIFLFHAFFAIAGLENHHSVASFILLLFCWMSLLFWLAFLMRWLGVCMYRGRKTKAAS